MRKSFITKEYSLDLTSGTFNQKEVRSFFSSKILELEDIMIIDSTEINWSENSDHTQGIGMDNYTKKLDPYLLKQNNHSVRIFPNQSQFDIKEFTKWEFTFNINSMIRDYLFAQLKCNRTFASIDNKNTVDDSVDNAIYNYIDLNILPRINFQTIDLYVRYYPLSAIQDNSVIALQYDTKFRKDLVSISTVSGETALEYQVRLATFTDKLKVKNFQLLTDPNQDQATIIYKQIESSLTYKFDYYFNVVYVKS